MCEALVSHNYNGPAKYLCRGAVHTQHHLERSVMIEKHFVLSRGLEEADAWLSDAVRAIAN